MSTRRRPLGMTLVELIVVLAIVGIVAAVVTSAGLGRSPEADPVDSALDDARVRAVRSGRAITRVVTTGLGAMIITASPDGSVLADSGLAVELLTGRRVRAAHPRPDHVAVDGTRQ